MISTNRQMNCRPCGWTTCRQDKFDAVSPREDAYFHGIFDGPGVRLVPRGGCSLTRAPDPAETERTSIPLPNFDVASLLSREERERLEA